MLIPLLLMPSTRSWVNRDDPNARIIYNGERFVMQYNGVDVYQSDKVNECACPTDDNVTWSTVSGSGGGTTPEVSSCSGASS